MNKYVEAAKKRAEDAREARNAKRDEAQKYVDEFKGGDNKKFISLRIRDGYIGKELDSSGRKLQTERARPRGTLVAVKGDNNEVKIGYTYLSNKDQDIPIVGIAEALKVAVGEKEPIQRLKNRDKELIDFFEIRAKCFFYPDVYSHSRGADKLTYPNYDKIHANRKRVLGEEA